MESGAPPKPKRTRRRLVTANEAWWHRNSKCTPDLTQEIVSYLREGLPIIHICGLVGISQDSYFRWLRMGKEYLDAPSPDPKHETFGNFYLSTQKAVAEWQLGIIRQSLTGEKYKAVWVRDMTVLERRDRDNWGRDDRGTGRHGVVDPDLKFL